MFSKAGLKSVDDSVDAASIKRVEKDGVSTTEMTERPALSDLQNQDIVRGVTAGDAVENDEENTQLQNALRAFVDTNWETTAAGIGTRTNVATGEVALNVSGAQRKLLTPSNSVSVSLGNSNTTTTRLGLQGAPSAKKVCENKLQPVTIITETAETETEYQSASSQPTLALTEIKAELPKNAGDAVENDEENTQLQNALRAFVDTNWETTAAGIGSRTNVATGEVALNVSGAQRKLLTPSNSVSVSLGNSNTTTTRLGLQGAPSAKKVCENKLQPVTIITETAKTETEYQSASSQRTLALTEIKAELPKNAGDAVENDEKNTQLQNALRAFVDTNWETTAAGIGTRTNVATGEVALNVSGAQRKLLTPSNSVSVSLGNSNTTTTRLGLQGAPSAKKACENKLQPVTIITETAETETEYQSASSQPTLALTEIKAELPKNVTAAAVGTPKPTLVRPFQFCNIDEGDVMYLVWQADYANDIYSYMIALEAQQPINQNHLDQQIEISPSMRSCLIDWINYVHMEFRLVPEIFQLAVAIIDLYLQAVKDTTKTDLQLVGITALFLAAKYEEQFPPSVADLIYMTYNEYARDRILRMEWKIFKELDYNLSRPLPIHFLRFFSKAADAEDSHHAMSKYFLELAMIAYDMSHYKPSETAAASLFLSLNLLKENATTTTGLNNKHWNLTLECCSRYTAVHLRPIAQKMARLARNAPSKLNVYIKYQGPKFEKVSTRPELYDVFMSSILNSEE